MSREKIWLSWSSGKDSAWSLHTLRLGNEYEVVALLTTINQAVGRVAMHAVREELLEAQAASLGLSLVKVFIPSPCPNEAYELAMAQAMVQARAEGISRIAFGDLFLEDIRKYREEKLAAVGMEPVFPIWGLETRGLAQEMVRAGLRAFVTCVNPKLLDPRFAGRIFDEQFLAELPESVDPCAERGEFHTCVYAGPMFKKPLPVRAGEIVTRDGFVFADALLSEAAPAHA